MFGYDKNILLNQAPSWGIWEAFSHAAIIAHKNAYPLLSFVAEWTEAMKTEQNLQRIWHDNTGFKTTVYIL